METKNENNKPKEKNNKNNKNKKNSENIFIGNKILKGHIKSCKHCVYYAKKFCKSFRISCSSTANAKICCRYTIKSMPKKNKSNTKKVIQED